MKTTTLCICLLLLCGINASSDMGNMHMRAMDGGNPSESAAAHDHGNMRGSLQADEANGEDNVQTVEENWSAEDMKPMYFHLDSSATFLFEGWTSTTPQELGLGCFVTFAMCFFAAFLGYYKRIFLLRNKANYMDDNSTIGIPKGVRLRLTLIFTFQTIVAGLVMLLYMTYNGWVFMSIVAGLAIGYYASESRFDASNGLATVAC